MYDDRTCVHRIAYSILRIPLYGDRASIKIGTQSISRNALNYDILVCHTCSDKTLAAAGLDPA
jgi:hypothetical protein